MYASWSMQHDPIITALGLCKFNKLSKNFVFKYNFSKLLNIFLKNSDEFKILDINKNE